MTLLFIILKGLLIGFSIAAPVGPIGFLCIRSTLKYGRTAGMAIGGGAACADTVYAILGIFSLGLVKEVISVYALPLRVIGGLFLLFLGARTIMAKTVESGPRVSASTLVKKFTSSFFLTLTNPATIFAFIAAFTAVGFHSAQGMYAYVMIASVFTGSLFWWFILSFSVSSIRTKINDANLHRVNVAAGVIIALFGVGALISVLWLI